MSCISRRVTNVAERNANCCSRQRASFNAAGFLSIHFEGAKKLKEYLFHHRLRRSFVRLFADFLSIWIHS